MAISGTQLTVADIERRLHEAEREVARLVAELDHHERLAAIGTVTAGIAHEIRNVLTPALAYSQMAKSRPDDQALQAKASERASSSLETAARIAEAILDFSQPNRNEPAIALVEDAFDRALACVGRNPAGHGIVITRRITPGSSASIQPVRLQQVLINLLMNAIEALQPDGGSITISASRCGTRMIIELADDGPGIAASVRSRLFEPFVSGNAKSGSGLGLSICRRIIEEAGGLIAARSAQGKGTTFTLDLPAA